MKKCPFRKTTNYIAYQNTGGGYPSEWITNEEFEDCIEEKCALFCTTQEYSNGYIKIKKCGLQHEHIHN